MSGDADRALREKIPDFAVAIFVVIAVVYIGQLALFFTARTEIRGELLKLLPGIPVFSFLAYLYCRAEGKSYRLRWDDEFVYFRPPGWTWRLKNKPEARMRFVDMIGMEAPQDRHSGGKDPYHPSNAIVIAGRNDPPGLYDDLITIYFQYFRRDSIDEFMRFLHSKRPDILPPGWVSRVMKPANLN